MKAVIVELRGNRAAVLSKDGNFSIVPNRNYTVGQIIELQDKKQNTSLFRRAASAAALIAVCAGITSYALPYSRVSLDVNPSFTYSLNLYDRVLKVTALNGDAEETVSSLRGKLFGKSINEAVAETLNSLNSRGYFATAGDADIVLSVSGNAAHAAALAENLRTSAETVTSGFDASASASSSFRIYSAAVTNELVKKAAEKGVSAGKLYMVEQLEDAKKGDSSFNADAWLNRSVKEITDAMEESSAPARTPEETVSAAPEKSSAENPPQETAKPMEPAIPADSTLLPQETHAPESRPEPTAGGNTRKPESKRNRQPDNPPPETPAMESSAAEQQPAETSAQLTPSGESGQQTPDSPGSESRKSGSESGKEIGPGITSAENSSADSTATSGSPENSSAENTADPAKESGTAGTDHNSHTETQGAAPGGNSPQPSPERGGQLTGGPGHGPAR